MALNIHGIVRATEDLDLFVRPDAGNIERLRAALRAIWNDPEIDGITADDLCGEYPAVRYGPPDGTLYRVKKDTVRPLDHAAALRRAFRLDEEKE